MIDLNDVRPLGHEPVRYDLDEIVRRLRDTAGSWVPQHFPNGRRNGDDWRLANINGAAPRKNGSCVITLKGEHAGDWIDFDGGQGGGPLSTLGEATGLQSRELYAHAAEVAGWSPGAPARQEPTGSTSKPEHDTSREIAFILDHSVALAGTPAAAYLEGRGLAIPDGADLLFHPDLTHWETKTGLPALIGVVRNRAGDHVAIHRTYLQVGEGRSVAKASVTKPRMMLGKVGGGAVRLAPLGDGAALGLSEGIESGLAVMTACAGLPVWATLSTTNLEQVMLPPAARRIVILADNDSSGAGARAAETAAQRLRAEGRLVVIALPPTEGDDFNDVLLRDGPEAVAAIVQAAFEPGDGNVDADAALPAIGSHLPIGYAGPDNLPTIRADDGDLDRAVARAWNVLRGSNEPPWLFRAAGLPTWVVPDDEGRPVAAQVAEERLRHMLAKLATWLRKGRDGELVPAHPPTALIKSVLATPDPGLPVLAGIVTTPVFGRGGTLLTEPGYHPDARLLYHAAPGFEVPPIPERPTQEEIAAARSLILDDLLGDFPFTSLAERAHGVAILLLGFVRAMVDGPTPLHLVEKPTPGTGATLMVDAIATILTGAGASVMTEGRDEEEWRKRVTAKLRQIPSLVLIDNLRHTLDCSALAAALTAPFWEDRVLGHSDMTRLPIRCVWIATGNNPDFSNEMARRLVRIRLDARVEQPWQRDGFRHPDLMGWVRANRGRLVAACLTLIRAWIAAGRPRGSRSIGSYESWAQTLGGVLDVAGIEGFLGNIDEMIKDSDKEGASWRSFVSMWWDRIGTAEVRTADLVEIATSCEPPLKMRGGSDHGLRVQLGQHIAKIRDRVFQLDGRSVRVANVGSTKNAQLWQLVIEQRAPAGPRTERGETATDEHSRHSPEGDDLVSVVSVGECRPAKTHQENSFPDSGLEVNGECGESFSNPYAYAHARAPVKKAPDKHSPDSPDSPRPEASTAYGGECGGESRKRHSPIPNPPDWLKEVL